MFVGPALAEDKAHAPTTPAGGPPTPKRLTDEEATAILKGLAELTGGKVIGG